MRWVSRYSESRIRAEGLTTLTRDFVARLPVRLRSAAARADLVWLYCVSLALTSLSMPCSSYGGSAGPEESWRAAHLLQRAYQVGDGLVGGAVFDRVPLEVAQVLVDGLIVDGLVLLHLCVVTVQYRPQAVADLVHDALARRIELRQLVGLLDQRIEGSNLELGDRKGGRGAAV
jgi:hypothetical protein